MLIFEKRWKTCRKREWDRKCEYDFFCWEYDEEYSRGKKINIEKLTLIQIHSNVMFFQAKDRTKILFLKGFPDAFLHKWGPYALLLFWPFLPKNEALWVVVHEETNEKKGEK